METRNKKNSSNIVGLIIILIIITSLYYFFFDRSKEEGRPESSGQSMQNAPTIDDPLERERVRTEDRPSFGSGIEDIE